MKFSLQFLIVTGSVSVALAQTQLVVPGGLANVEGNSSSSDLFSNGEARFQQIYAASEFNFGAPTGRIDGISFRLESGTGAVIGSWGLSVYLSTTMNSPDSLSPIFTENHGSDVTVVRFGTVGIFAASNGLSPRPFEVHIPFTIPFFYDPSRGNLTVDFVTSGTRDVFLDAQLAPSDSIARAFTSETGTIGTVDSLGLITRFDITPIPEPTSSILLLLGGLTFVLQRHVRSNSHKDRH